jgi:hypothetical protein
MALETIETFRPSIDNGVGYVGLIQFGKEAAKTIKTTRSIDQNVFYRANGVCTETFSLP